MRIQIKQGKRPIAPRKNSSTVVNKKPHFKKLTHSAPSENIVTLERVHKVAESINKKISEFGEMMSKLDDIQNKHAEQYTCLFSESQYEYGSTEKPSKANSIKDKSKSQQKSIHLKKTQKRHPRSAQQKGEKNAEKPNKKHIKNLSDKKLTNDQINLLAKG